MGNIFNGDKNQNTYFIGLLGAELCYDSVVIYETEAKTSLMVELYPPQAKTVLFFCRYWNACIKQAFDNNIDSESNISVARKKM